RIGHRLELAEAVVAGAAAVLFPPLAEVTDEEAMPAADGRRVAFHVAQQRPPRLDLSARLLEHRPPAGEVAARIDQHALRLEAIAPRTPRFLLVVLERLRRAGMHYEAHVRSVDPHAE